MKHWMRIVMMLALLAFGSPAYSPPPAAAAVPRLVVFEGFLRPT